MPNDLSLLKAKDFVIKGRKRSNLELTIEPVEGQTPDEVKFDWTVLSFTSWELRI